MMIDSAMLKRLMAQSGFESVGANGELLALAKAVWVEAQREELASTKESSVTQPKCGRCGKHQIADIHTCTATEWARKMEEELSSVKAENVKLRGVLLMIDEADSYRDFLTDIERDAIGEAINKTKWPASWLDVI